MAESLTPDFSDHSSSIVTGCSTDPSCDCFPYNEKYISLNVSEFDCTKMQVYVDAAILEAPEGVYTWIYAAKVDSTQYNFYFVEVVTTNEVCNKHTNIVKLVGPALLQSAGELDKSASSKINLLSGSYMSFKPEQQQYLLRQAQQFMSKFGFNVECKEGLETFITDENIKKDKARLTKLIQCGAKLAVFDSKEDCMAYKKIKIENVIIEARHEIQVRAAEKNNGPRPPDPTYQVHPSYRTISTVEQFDEFEGADPGTAPKQEDAKRSRRKRGHRKITRRRRNY